MQIRLAWLGDPEYANTYSAREGRVLLRALGRHSEITPLWFAVGSNRPPHWWDHVRVFPIPRECPDGLEFVHTLANQLQANVLYSNLERPSLPARFEHFTSAATPWIHRVNPEERDFDWFTAATTVLAGTSGIAEKAPHCAQIPFLDGSSAGTGVSEILGKIESAICACAEQHSLRHHNNGAACFVMRHQLFCNTSLSHVMFELTNALIELGVRAVPQDEQPFFAKSYVQREEELFRLGAGEKYSRLKTAADLAYDPDRAIIIHFAMLRPGISQVYFGAFPSLGPREVLYPTGNHVVASEIKLIADRYERVIAPSNHVLRPYLEAGLSRRLAGLVPHGIDPAIFSPSAEPFVYPTKKRFKFLQTSFPWIIEKGFDITVKAFCSAFTTRDDVALILRIPSMRRKGDRGNSIDRLEQIVREARSKPGAPDILLLEADVPLNQRGGIYTGAGCYVHPHRAEGFGMTILEALACGLPVISTPWSGPADFLSSRYAYTLQHSAPIPEKTNEGKLLRYHVEPDRDHLVELMRHAFLNQDESRAYGQRASAAARTSWTWRAAARKLANLFSIPCANAIKDMDV